MEGFKKNSYASHVFSKVELAVILLAIVLVVLVAYPKVSNALSNVKINSAIDSAYSYKDSVYNYYLSQLMIDTDFKLNGYYTISEGKLSDEKEMHNIHMIGNIPSTGYLDYEDNILKNGCIVVDEYAVTIENGEVIEAIKGTCEQPEIAVVLGM